MSFRGKDDFAWLSLAFVGMYLNLSDCWAIQYVSALGAQVSARDAQDCGCLGTAGPHLWVSGCLL